MRTAVIGLAAAGIMLAGCGTSPATGPASSSSAPASPAAAAAPSWCTSAFAAAINGKDPAKLLPYVHDSRYIRQAEQEWALSEVENRLQYHPWSIAHLENDAPVTVGMPDGQADIERLNHLCSGG